MPESKMIAASAPRSSASEETRRSNAAGLLLTVAGEAHVTGKAPPR